MVLISTTERTKLMENNGVISRKAILQQLTTRGRKTADRFNVQIIQAYFSFNYVLFELMNIEITRYGKMLHSGTVPVLHSFGDNLAIYIY